MSLYENNFFTVTRGIDEYDPPLVIQGFMSVDALIESNDIFEALEGYPADGALPQEYCDNRGRVVAFLTTKAPVVIEDVTPETLNRIVASYTAPGFRKVFNPQGVSRLAVRPRFALGTPFFEIEPHTLHTPSEGMEDEVYIKNGIILRDKILSALTWRRPFYVTTERDVPDAAHRAMAEEYARFIAAHHQGMDYDTFLKKELAHNQTF